MMKPIKVNLGGFGLVSFKVGASGFRPDPFQFEENASTNVPATRFDRETVRAYLFTTRKMPLGHGYKSSPNLIPS